MNKFIVSIAIVLAAAILGSTFYVVQINKQQSIERQQQKEAQAKAEQEKTAKEAADEQAFALKNCMAGAHETFVKEGQSACFEFGFNQEEINSLKCKLPAVTLKHIEDKQTLTQDLCLKLYK